MESTQYNATHIITGLIEGSFRKTFLSRIGSYDSVTGTENFLFENNKKPI